MSERLKLFAFGCVVLGASLAGTAAFLHVHLTGHAGTLFTTMWATAPVVVAVLVSTTRFKAPLADVLGLRMRPSPWLFAAWLLPVPIAVVAFLLALTFPGARIAENVPWLWFQAVVPYTGWLALLALPQEAAWRGFLLGALRPSFVRAWVVTGAAWAAWQVPLALLSGDAAPVWVRLGATAGFVAFATPLALLVRLRSGSVIASSVLVGGLQATTAAVAQATNVSPPFALSVALVPLALAAGVVATRETRQRRETAPVGVDRGQAAPPSPSPRAPVQASMAPPGNAPAKSGAKKKKAKKKR